MPWTNSPRVNSHWVAALNTHAIMSTLSEAGSRPKSLQNVVIPWASILSSATESKDWDMARIAAGQQETQTSHAQYIRTYLWYCKVVCVKRECYYVHVSTVHKDYCHTGWLGSLHINTHSHYITCKYYCNNSYTDTYVHVHQHTNRHRHTHIYHTSVSVKQCVHFLPVHTAMPLMLHVPCWVLEIGINGHFHFPIIMAQTRYGSVLIGLGDG